MPESRSIPVPVASRPPRTLSSLPAVATVASAPISERRVGPAPAAARRWAACASGGSKARAGAWTPRAPRCSATASRVVAGFAAQAQTSAPAPTRASKYGTILTSRWQTTSSRSPRRDGTAAAAACVAGVNSRIQPSSRARISSRPDTRHLLIAPSAVYPLSGAHAPRDGEIHLRLVRLRRPVIAPVALVFVTLYDAEERCDLRETGRPERVGEGNDPRRRRPCARKNSADLVGSDPCAAGG